MGLSRLDNFLKSVRGTILYVDPSSLDATDSIENQGNSLTRPFKTIQRALVEAARFSYQRGLDNDRFAKTTILLYPGEHFIDNRPGWIPDGASNFRMRDGSTTNDFPQWSITSNFDITSTNNALYKMNSIHGGVIIPRGTSIVGMDLRKTKIRPLYVPAPENNNIERSSVFKVTGACYLWQFTILDADPNGICYKDYTTNTFVPNFSHHKLSGFEYADGVNNVKIDDTFQTWETARTDLDMYYEKVELAYGSTSGRPIEPDYPSASEDLQPIIDEYRIVGSRGAAVGITSIRSGNGITGNTTITVTFEQSFENQLSVDTPIQIQGIQAAGYDGQYVVSAVNSTTEIQYKVQNVPTNLLPPTTGATLNIAVDTVTSASPYIFNISLRSVYGMCGMLADGSKADGFKSMVVAQYTGIWLQKDDNAFVKYDSTSGTYRDSTAITNLHSDSRARFKPTYENFHIKAINNSYVQLVSVFAIGYAQHFAVESGGDFSINNSNSNFGSKALTATGFRSTAFPRDDIGYITHVIGPKEIETEEVSVNFGAIDITNTVGIASTTRLYLYGETDVNSSPSSVIDGYRIGAKVNDTLYVELSNSGVTTTYSARIVMPNTQYSSEKIIPVGRSVSGINSIASNIFTLTGTHSFLNGESIRVIADNAHLPDGLETNQIYYAITNTTSVGLGSDQIKVAQTLNDAINDNELDVNSKGGVLKIVSRVSDKNSGDIGYPIQWDSTQSQWYIGVATDNGIYPVLNTASYGTATPRTYLTRTPDNRGVVDTSYRVRYVIPKDATTLARPPLDGYILQESNDVIGAGTTEIQKYFNPTGATLSNSTELRNFRFISGAEWASGTAKVSTELPHDLSVGAEVEIINVLSTNNLTGIANSAYNGTHTITGISSAKQFSFALTNNPGTFSNDTTARTGSLPYFRRKRLASTYQVYRSQEVQPYIQGAQDGIYHLILINSSNSPTVAPFTDLKFLQPVQNLYPQTNRDNPNSDPVSTKTFAVAEPIGRVVINDPQNSLTRETIEKNLFDFNVGVGLTNIISSGVSTHTLYSAIDHGLCGITSVSIANAGAGYSSGIYYGARLINPVGGATTSGKNATARVTVSAGGTITNVTIMDGGSAYGVGTTLSIAGITTVSGYSPSVLTITNIYNNVGDCISISGVSSNSYQPYNNLYKITSVTSPTQIEVQSSETISPLGPSIAGIGSTLTANATAILTGKALSVTLLTYDYSSGIGTLTFPTAHGFRVNQKLRIGGADQSFFNDDFIVKTINSSTSLAVAIGASTAGINTGGTMTAYRPFLSSYGGDLTRDNENTSGRLIAPYAGITTTLGTNFASTASDVDPIVIPNADILGLKIGDYLQIDDEIVRIRTNVSGSTVYVFRSLFGTQRQNHQSGTAVRKIKPQPIEFRRNSIIRASGHTFEYLGYGPGNYSTAFPERQDRILTAQEVLLAQSVKLDGGVSIYTGMDDKGNFYTGNKKLNSATGQEEVYDAPIPTTTGEDPGTGGVNVGFDVLSPLEVSVNRSLRVEGGQDNNLISQFDGPVVFNNKVTTNSEKGIEAKSLFVQGNADVSRKFTVGVGSTPTSSGNPGDIITRAFPEHNKYLGWIYTLDNYWEPFGFIGTLPNGLVFGAANQVLYKNPLGQNAGNNDFLFQNNSTLIIGIGASTNVANQKLQVGGGAYLNGFVGIASSAPSAALDVVGNARISGIVTIGTASVTINGNTNTITAGITSIKSGIITATSGIVTYYGDGQYLQNIDTSSWANVPVGLGTGIYSKSLLRVGIGTILPQSQLDVVSGLSTSVDAKLARFSAPDLGIGSVTSIAFGKQFSNFQSSLFAYNYFGSSASSGSFLSISHSGQGNTLVVADSDRVGVGIANPQAKLHVSGDGRFDSNVVISGALSVNSNVVISGALNVTGDITAFYTSDQRLKDNITPIPNALDKVLSISGNTFDWNEKSGKEGTDVGVVAQEILEVLPEAVTTRDNGYLAVRYEKLVPLLIEAIKELKQEVKELKGEN